jgi:hypothetical protein
MAKEQGLQHVSEILPGMEEITAPQREPEPIKALTVQGKHHFTRLKQIDALAGIGDDPNADMGFMARLLTLCSLPRTDPGSRLQYKRQNGPYKLIMIAGGDNKLPFGNLPRLLLAWVSTEAVRTKERELILGNSLAAFMRQLGMHSDSGGDRGDRTRLRHQVDRLFNAHVQLIYESPGHKATASSSIADRTELWWNYRKPEQDTLWQSRIFLGEAFFNEIIAHPVPLDMQILRGMKRPLWGSISTCGFRTKPSRCTRAPRSPSACPGNGSTSSSAPILPKSPTSTSSAISARTFCASCESSSSAGQHSTTPRPPAASKSAPARRP